MEGTPQDPGELGGIISGWLLQMVVFLAVLAFIGHEMISVVVTTVSLDDTAREVARSARDEYRVTRSIDAATLVAISTADQRDARLIDVAAEGDELVVELGRDAPTLLIHRIGVLQDLTMVTTSARVSWAT